MKVNKAWLFKLVLRNKNLINLFGLSDTNRLQILYVSVLLLANMQIDRFLKVESELQ